MIEAYFVTSMKMIISLTLRKIIPYVNQRTPRTMKSHCRRSTVTTNTLSSSPSTTSTGAATITATSVFKFMSLVIAVGSGVHGQSPDAFPGAPPIQYSTLSGPTFLNSSTATVKAVAGTTAMLPCVVKNLHNYTVSWVRGRDIRLLTTSTITYTSDSRFVAVKLAGGSHWLLKIHYVRSTDAGIYLCQVSTSPPLILSVNVAVQESMARVLPGPEVYVQVGSRLEVVCQVEGCPPPALLSWTRFGQSVGTSALEEFSTTEGNVTMPIARLKLVKAVASPANTGNYSCSSTCTGAVNVAVHVLRGEELAAMQHHNASQQLLPTCLLFPCLLVWALLQWHWHHYGYVQNYKDLSIWQHNTCSFGGVLWRREDGLFSGSLTTT